MGASGAVWIPKRGSCLTGHFHGLRRILQINSFWGSSTSFTMVASMRPAADTLARAHARGGVSTGAHQPGHSSCWHCKKEQAWALEKEEAPQPSIPVTQVRVPG